MFQPYNREQLKDIVLARLADAGATAAFNPRAIEYAARKVTQATLRKVAKLLTWGCPRTIIKSMLFQ